MSTKTLRGTLTRLAERVTTPLLPNDYLDVIDPLLSGIGARGRNPSRNARRSDAGDQARQGWRPHTRGSTSGWVSR